MERYKARWVNSYFSIFLLTDLWDCWMLTACLSIIINLFISHNRVLGLTLVLSIECLKIQFTTVQRLESNEEGSLQLWTQFMWLLRKPEKNSGLQWDLNPWPRDTNVICSNQLNYEATDVGSWSFMCLLLMIYEINHFFFYVFIFRRNWGQRAPFFFFWDWVPLVSETGWQAPPPPSPLPPSPSPFQPSSLKVWIGHWELACRLTFEGLVT